MLFLLENKGKPAEAGTPQAGPPQAGPSQQPTQQTQQQPKKGRGGRGMPLDRKYQKI